MTTEKQKRTLGVFLLLFSIVSFDIYAASFELWPAERRRSNTVYVVGGEYNHLLFSFTSKDSGKHEIKLPTRFDKPLTLVLDLPVDIDFKGTTGLRSGIQEELVQHDGTDYVRRTTTFSQDGDKGLNNRLIDNNYYYRIVSWIIPPKGINANIYWQLKYGRTIWAKASSSLVDVGTIDPDLELPKRFFMSFSGGANLYSFPDKTYKPLAELYRRLGVGSTDIIYSGGELSKNKIAYARAMHEVGIRNNALPAGSFVRYRKTNPKQYGNKGLVWGAAEEARGINSEKERKSFAAVAQYFDGFTYDYEPHGPRRIPAYDDKPTMEAFAEEHGIREKLTPELLKGKYRKAYFAYRQKLLTLPIAAAREMTNAAKPVSLFVEQGNGINSHIDYRLYDGLVDYHCPMIYTSSQLDYYTRVLAMAKYIEEKKVVPDTSFGYTFSTILRQNPESAMMEVVATAAAGCAAIRHWPGLLFLDEGMLWGMYRGMAMVAQGEPFYFDGVETDKIDVKGLPYTSKTVQVGSRTLDLSQPDWKSALRSHVHQLGDEYLVTILNFNADEDAYVSMESGVLKDKVLLDPITQKYIAIGGDGRTVVKVAKNSPALWIVTDKETRISRSEKMDEKKALAEFKRRQKAFKAKQVSPSDNANLLFFTFQDSDGDGFPDGYKKDEINSAYISYVKTTKSTTSPVLQVIGSDDRLIGLDLESHVQFKKGKKYLFSVQVKIEDMDFTGHWYKDNRGFWAYVYGQDNRHTWAAVSGIGSTDGWVNVMLPFDTIGMRNEAFEKSLIFLRFNKARGTYYVKEPIIIERGLQSDMRRHFIEKDGSVKTGSRLEL